MTAEQMDTYKMRITQCGIAELTVVMLEMEMDWIREAMDLFEKGDITAYQACLEKAKGTQIELLNVLNLKNAVAVDVYSIFVYINKLLIQSGLRKKPQELDRCISMLEAFHKSFQTLVPTDTAGPVMEQSARVYAGLTYGAHGLVESSMGGHDYSL